MATAPQTKEDWMQRIEPALTQSMQAVTEQMTNVPTIQRWIRSASYEVGMQASRQADVQAEAAAYGALRDDLYARFAPLADAVDELTNHAGQLDVRWRPLSPNYTRLFIRFEEGYEIDLLVRLRAASSDEAQRALDVAAEALPRSQPFPNRPNERTALTVLEGRRLGVRVRDHLAEGGRRRTVTLLPGGSDASPESDIPFSEAPSHIVKHLTPEAGSRIDPETWI